MKISSIIIATAIALRIFTGEPQPVVDSSVHEPFGEVGSALHLLPVVNYCVDVGYYVTQQQWPVYQVIQDWNANGIKKFTTDSEETNCQYTVIVTLGNDETIEYGHTEIFHRNIIHVQLGDAVPNDKFRTTLCHEFGHVLGLPHSSGDGSCMDPYQDFPTPTPDDLKKVAKS